MPQSDEVTLSLGQIEAIVGTPLPPSAYLPEWWTGRSANQVRAQVWRVAGWDALPGGRRGGGRWVTFVRRLARTPENHAR